MFVCSIRIEYGFQTVIMSIQLKLQLTVDYYYCAWILVSTPVTKTVINNPVYF